MTTCRKEVTRVNDTGALESLDGDGAGQSHATLQALSCHRPLNYANAARPQNIRRLFAARAEVDGERFAAMLPLYALLATTSLSLSPQFTPAAASLMALGAACRAVRERKK